MNLINMYIHKAIETHKHLENLYLTNSIFSAYVDQICACDDDVEAARKILEFLLSEMSISVSVLCSMAPEHRNAFYEVAIDNFINGTICNCHDVNSQVVALIMQAVYNEHHKGKDGNQDGPASKE